MPTETKINKLIEFLEGFSVADFQQIEYVLRHADSIYKEFEATNHGRVTKVQAVIQVFYADTPETDITDLLADVRHFCDANGLDFAARDRMAHQHYTDEVVAERRAEDG